MLRGDIQHVGAEEFDGGIFRKASQGVGGQRGFAAPKVEGVVSHMSFRLQELLELQHLKILRSRQRIADFQGQWHAGWRLVRSCKKHDDPHNDGEPNQVMR